MAVPARKLATGGSPVRVQNANTEQTVDANPGVLRRVILSNSGAAATLTIKNGATTLQVLNVPASTAAPVSLEMGFGYSTSLKVTPSNVSVDALFVIN
jgi:hypothetical protein